MICCSQKGRAKYKQKIFLNDLLFVLCATFLCEVGRKTLTQSVIADMHSYVVCVHT